MKNKKKIDTKSLPIEVRAEIALKKAVADAVARHKRMGHPIAVWRDGRAVWIPAEEIIVPEVDEADTGRR
jgi:hypothetical protein